MTEFMIMLCERSYLYSREAICAAAWAEGERTRKLVRCGSEKSTNVFMGT